MLTLLRTVTKIEYVTWKIVPRFDNSNNSNKKKRIFMSFVCILYGWLDLVLVFLHSSIYHVISMTWYIKNSYTATLTRGIPWITTIVAWYTYSLEGTRLYRQNASNSWDIPRYSQLGCTVTQFRKWLENNLVSNLKKLYCYRR